MSSDLVAGCRWIDEMNVGWMNIDWMSSVWACLEFAGVGCVYTNAQDASSVIVEGSEHKQKSPAGTPGARRRLRMFGAIGVTERVRERLRRRSLDAATVRKLLVAVLS